MWLYSPPNLTACVLTVQVRLLEICARQSSSVVGRKLRVPVVPIDVLVPAWSALAVRGRFSSEYWPRVSMTTRGEKIAGHWPVAVFVGGAWVPSLLRARVDSEGRSLPVCTAFSDVFLL